MDAALPRPGQLVVSETIDTAADTAGQRKNAVFKRIPICPPRSPRARANPSRFNDLANRSGRDAVEGPDDPVDIACHPSDGGYFRTTHSPWRGFGDMS